MVHEADHQHFARFGVLNDGGNEPVEFCEIHSHCHKEKAPLGVCRRGSVKLRTCRFDSSVQRMRKLDRPAAAGMVMVPVVMLRAKHLRQSLSFRSRGDVKWTAVDAFESALRRVVAPYATSVCGDRRSIRRPLPSPPTRDRMPHRAELLHDLGRMRRPFSIVTVSGSHWWCIRGASTASPPLRPNSVTPKTTVKHRVDDRAAARRSGDQHHLAAPGHHRRRHRAEHPLARIDQVGRRANVAA